VSFLGLVENAHLVAFLDHPLGDRGANTAAADYQDEHVLKYRSEAWQK
jgi:hypothetical protein